MTFRAAAVALFAWLAPFASAAPLETFQDCDACPVMIELPVGDFIMGAPDDEFRRNVVLRDGKFYTVTPDHPYVIEHEGPQRHVTVDIPFAMSRDEITYEQWMACVDDGGCGGYIPPTELLIPASRTTIKAVDLTGTMPMINVDFAEALSYVAWLNEKTSLDAYRLPTEAEWEYAARAGTTTRFAQGDTIDDQQANFSGSATRFLKADPRQDLINRDAPVPVETLDAANGWGLRHMSGNVAEMTTSCFTEKLPDLSLTSQWQSESRLSGCFRVIRGGAFFSPIDVVRVASRPPLRTDVRQRFVGIRVVKELD